MRLRLTALVILLVLGTLVACSGDSEPSAEPSSSQATVSTVAGPVNGHVVFSRIPTGLETDDRAWLYVTSPDARDEKRLSARRFDYGGLVTFSPDGQLIAFTRNRKLWVGRADGSYQRQVSQTEGLNLFGQWSPDGSQLLYFRSAGVGGSGDTTQLVRADGTGFREIGPGDERLFTRAWWAADGRHVYGIDGGKLAIPPALYRLDLETGEATLLVEGETGTEALWVSASGNVLALRSVPHPVRRQLWLLTEGEERLLAETRGQYWHLDWSPDENRIAVSVLFGDDDTARIVVLNLDRETTQISETTGVPGHKPVWAPDGRALAFARGTFPHDDVWILDDTGHERRLTKTPNLEQPVAWLEAAP